MSLTVTVNFTPAPPVAGKTFHALRIALTDASGVTRNQDVPAATVAAEAQPQPDGSYNLAATFTNPNPAVGAYTVTAQAITAGGTGYGPVATSSGTVPLADGAWFASPVAFV